MKRTITIAGLLFASLCSFAGDPEKNGTTSDEGSRNSVVFKKHRDKVNGIPEAKAVIKWNLTPLIFGEFAFQAEYAFHKNMSGALGFNIMPARGLPSIFLGGASAANEFLTKSELSHWSITPEFRFYPGRKETHQAPAGFYIAPYMRYEKYTYTTGYGGTLSDGKRYDLSLQAKFGGATFGLMLGAQWRLAQNFYLDWWIVGGSIGSASFDMTAAVSNVNLTPSEQAEAKATIEDNFDKISTISGGKPTVTVNGNSATASLSGLPFSGFRAMGICLGFAF